MDNQPEPCVFCHKLARLDDLPDSETVWQFPHSVALLGPWQHYQGYCILVSRRHATEFSQLSFAERHAYFEEMCALARAIETVFQPRKMNYELLGNQVAHLHWHLFPRRSDDPDMLKPVWLALDRAEQDEAWRHRLHGRSQAKDTAARIRKAVVFPALDAADFPVK